MPVEDFEEATTVPAGIDGIDEPLNAATASGPFAPGDILPGLTIATFEGSRGGCPIECPLVALGDGLIGQADVIVGPNFFVDTMLLIFSPGVLAAGLDLLVPVAETFDIEIFGDSGSLGTTTAAASPTGLFFGVASHMAPHYQHPYQQPRGRRRAGGQYCLRQSAGQCTRAGHGSVAASGSVLLPAAPATGIKKPPTGGFSTAWPDWHRP